VTPTSNADTTSTSTTPERERCHTSELGGAFTADEGAAGNHRFDVQLTNTSGHVCTVTGYPGIGFLTTDRRSADLPVDRGAGMLARDPGPSRISLAPGEAASASVTYTIECADAATAVRPGYVEVTPPDEEDFVLIVVQPPESVFLCGSKIHVTALMPGTAGAPKQ
jgi:hypothetical protein